MVFFLQDCKCMKAIVGSMGWNIQHFIELPSKNIDAVYVVLTHPPAVLNTRKT